MKLEEHGVYWIQIDGEAHVALWEVGNWLTLGSECPLDVDPEVLCMVEMPRGKEGCEACDAGDCCTHCGGDWAITK